MRPFTIGIFKIKMFEINASSGAVRKSIIKGIIFHSLWFSPPISLGIFACYHKGPIGPWLLGISIIIYLYLILKHIGFLSLNSIKYQSSKNSLVVTFFSKRAESTVKLNFNEIVIIKKSKFRLCPQIIIRDKNGILQKDIPVMVLGLNSLEINDLVKYLLQD